MIEELKALGLTEGEIKVYSAILDLGIATINKIHERTGLERRTIYDVINKLIEKGLISYTTENKKKTYQCAHPNRILAEINNKERGLEELKKKIPGFITQFQAPRPKINSEVFRGSEGIKAVWEDMLNYKEIYWIGSGRYVPKKFPPWFSDWNKRRIKLKVKWYNLLRHELRKEIKAMPYEFVKFLPEEFSGNPIVIGIYGNKVVNFVFSEQFFAFVIESKEIAENYKKYHKYLWDSIR